MSYQRDGGKKAYQPKSPQKTNGVGNPAPSINPQRTSSAPPNLSEQQAAVRTPPYVPFKTTVHFAPNATWVPGPEIPPQQQGYYLPAYGYPYGYAPGPFYSVPPLAPQIPPQIPQQTSQQIPVARERRPLAIVDPTTHKEINVEQQKHEASAKAETSPPVFLPEISKRPSQALPIVPPSSQDQKQTVAKPSPPAQPQSQSQQKQTPEVSTSSPQQSQPQSPVQAVGSPPSLKSEPKAEPASPLTPVNGDTERKEASEKEVPKKKEDELQEEEEEEEEEEEYEENYEEEGPEICYLEGIYNPHTKTGHFKYPRSFLLQFQEICVDPPEKLPKIEDFERAVRNSPRFSRGRYSSQMSPRRDHRYNDSPRGRSKMLRGPSSPSHRGRNRNLRSSSGPLHPDVQLIATPNRWEPTRKLHKDVKEEDLILRKVKGMLNKITEENFGSLSDKIMKYLQDSRANEIILKGVLNLIFEKALRERKFSPMYAELCNKLKNCKIEADPDSKNTFRRLLLNKCQEDFEKNFGGEAKQREVNFESMTKEQILQYEEEAYFEKKKILGNINFIAELFKISMLTRRVMLECILQLFGKTTPPPADNLEALCQLLTPIGKILEEKSGPEEKASFDECFRRMEKLTQSEEVSLRIRFLMRDVIELRQNNWLTRKEQKLVASSSPMPSPVREGYSSRDSTPRDSPFAREQGRGTPSSSGQSTPLSDRESRGDDGWEVVSRNKHRHGASEEPKRPAPPATKSVQKSIEAKPQAPGPARNLFSNLEEDKSGNLSEEQVEEQIKGLMKEYLISHAPEDTAESLKELKIGEMAGEAIYYILYFGLEQNDPAVRVLVADLLKTTYHSQVFTQQAFERGFTILFENLPDIVLDIPKSPQFVGEFCGAALAHDLFSLSVLFKLCSGTTEVPVASVAAEALRNFVKQTSEDSVRQKLKETPFNLLDLIPKRDEGTFRALLKEKDLQSFEQFLKQK